MAEPARDQTREGKTMHPGNPTLYEEILLLALDDDKGTTPMEGMFRNAMGAATREAVQAVQAAVFVCTMVPVITTAGS